MSTGIPQSGKSGAGLLAREPAGKKSRHLLIVTALLLLLVCNGAGQTGARRAQDTQALEYPVKAAFLLNFTKFIEWPAPPKGAPEHPFTICVLGEDPFGPVLDQTIQGENVEGRRLEVKRVSRETSSACEIIYVGKSEKGVAEYLKGIGPEVLTVGEGESFLRDGGMIAFVIDNRRVRFIVRLTAARDSALKFSSRLLNVARSVEN